MIATLHAILVIATLLLPLTFGAVGRNRRRRLRPVSSYAGFLAAHAVIGAACLTLMIPGVPVAEWLFPLCGTIAASIVIEDNRVWRWTAWLSLFASIGLCGSALELRMHGYTSEPMEKVEKANALRMKAVENALRSSFGGDRVFDECPARGLLLRKSEAVNERRVSVPLWHTRITRLRELRTTGEVVWYPGGTVSHAASRLYWRSPSHEAQ